MQQCVYLYYINNTHTHHKSQSIADTKRLKFVKEKLNTRTGVTHAIRQSEDFIFDDVLSLYKNKKESLLQEHPFRVQYVDEKAVDIGGVARDVFSTFWEVTYIQAFDGGNVLLLYIPIWICQSFLYWVPLYHMGTFPVAFYPSVSPSLPLLVVQKGPGLDIPDSILLSSFMDHVSIYSGRKHTAQFPSKQCAFITRTNWFSWHT